jgi:hypothetical protein
MVKIALAPQNKHHSNLTINKAPKILQLLTFSLQEGTNCTEIVPKEGQIVLESYQNGVFTSFLRYKALITILTPS